LNRVAPSSTAPDSRDDYDAVIVGSGLAGLSTALKLLENGEAATGHPFRIALLTKGALADGACTFIRQRLDRHPRPGVAGRAGRLFVVDPHQGLSRGLQRMNCQGHSS